MTTVYIVTAGQYSDYRICAVYLDKAKADAFVAYYNGIEARDSYDRADIEEWDADSVDISADRKPWGVCTKRGSLEIACVVPETYHLDRTSVDCFSGDEGAVLTITVYARDAEHAVKIAADKFREYKALNP